MLEIVALACLIDAPSNCKDVALSFSEEAMTPMQCFIQAQGELAKWVTEHPKWKIERYACQPAGAIAKI